MSANFQPEVYPYKETGSFRFWCQKVLPLVYDDSLSYYELLCKVVKYLNDVIANVDGLHDDVLSTNQAFYELQGYVNNYFTNLDVQEEINTKLNAMAVDGTLSELISPFVSSEIGGVVAEQIGDTVASQIGDTVASQISDVVAEQIATPTANATTAWLNENVDPVGSAVVVDSSLRVQGAAADAKMTGSIRASLENEFASNVDGFTSNPLAYYIDSNNVWKGSGNSHVMIPVKSGDVVYVKANNSYTCYFAVLTEYDMPSADNQVPSFSSGSGFTTRIALGTGNDNTYTMPNDAKYISFNNVASGNSYFPSEVKVNGVNILSGIRKELETINSMIYNYSLANGTDLDTVVEGGMYRLGINDTYPNAPVNGGRRLLIVSDSFAGYAHYQILIQADTGEIYSRCYHDESWDNWANSVTTLRSVVYNTGLTNDTDLNTLQSTGIYRLGAGSTYPNQPVSGGRRILFVSSQYPTAASYQILFKCDTGECYMRTYHDISWDNWKSVIDANATKISLGSNPYRKSLDHGGFYNTRYGNKLIYQNSPEAFISSMKEGIVFHNLDVVFSSDGVPFVSHDVSVPVVSGGTINLNNLTAEQIKTYMVGDSDYSWELQTLDECNGFIKSIGGMIDMVDVTASNNATQIANAGNLPSYYRNHNIKPTWTNFDYDDMRDAFLANGSEFGLYFVCNSEATILHAISYIEENTGHKYCMNIGCSNATVMEAISSRIGTVSGLGVVMYAYTYNKSNVNNVPNWADGVVSENCNANYEQWVHNMP